MSVKTINSEVSNLLEPLGFSRRNTTWNRRTGLVVEVVDIQVNKTGDAITVNAGVLDTQAHAAFWGAEPSDFIEQPNCTVCVRVGELIDGKDKWWQLQDANTSADLAKIVKTYVLPFLDQTRTRKSMKQWLIDTRVTKRKYPAPIINLAILESFIGQRALACEILAELRQKFDGVWRVRADDVAKRLNCT